MINLTLNQLKRPALSNLVPKFGTKVEKNDINKGGLSTEEVDRNVTLPFELMREVEVSSSDTTTKIQYDAKIAIVGSDPVTLTLDKASYKGCVITITNRSTEQATIVLSEDNQKNLESKKSLVLEWDGTVWNDTALVVDSTVSENSNKPVSSAAVYQKATEITEAYTQAIAGETTARSEAITAVEQKVTEETNARTQADTALGTRIDEEVEARTNADTNFTQQIEAIERLHATLIGPGDFVDTDGDTVTVNDSNKSIRQIAHEEFYRQLITDADNVQSQIDTLKELADYLQTNPSVIADMYNKLGVTWSVDNPTDFGTFDFSGVLSATNVDDAVLELYNTFTNKIGDLTQLTTTFKDSIVGAVNELDADIGNEVTARTDADTTLGARIDGEVTAREQADTALGTRIDNEVGTLSALTTTAKDNVVAAINEVNGKVGTGGGGDAASTASNCEQFTFVVDSNEKLTAWANNDKASGQDYTSVLIRRGEWTSTTGVNLTTSGTKVVVGEPGSKLAFNNANKGLYYNTVPTGPEYYMRDVTVKVTHTGTNASSSYGFHTCSNLTNCTSTATATTSSSDADSGGCNSYGFATCSNLTNCTGIANGNGYDSGSGYGFYDCSHLSNCVGSGTGTSKPEGKFGGSGSSYGFHTCSNLTNCAGTTGDTKGYSVTQSVVFAYCSTLSSCSSTISYGYDTGSNNTCSGFDECKNLSNCDITIEGNTIDGISATCQGFAMCLNLTNCTSTVTGTSGGDASNGGGVVTDYGFTSCSNLTNCVGTANGDRPGGGSGTIDCGFHACSNLTNCTGTGNGSNTGFGFDTCKTVIGCKAGKHCSTSVFKDCYASSSETSTYACADTPNGGFNNTTNPAA